MLFWTFFSVVSLQAQLPNPDRVKKVGARKMPSSKKIFSVNSCGPVNDGKTLATSSIQKVIDACSAKGGGIVTFKPGNTY